MNPLAIPLLAALTAFCLSGPLHAADNTSLKPKEMLGRHLFFDAKLSDPEGQSCASCHAPETGFTGPHEEINKAGAVYEGAARGRFSNRKPPTSSYGGGSPVLHFNRKEKAWAGGMFWDGRATGNRLKDPLAEQAQAPLPQSARAEHPRRRDETAGELHDRLSESGADLMLEALDLVQSGNYESLPQNNQLSSPAPKLTREHCHLSFAKPVLEEKNWIHGLSPFPTSFAYYREERINFYRARINDFRQVQEAPGTILKSDPGTLEIVCAPGIIEILELQKEGKKRLPADDFIRGYELKPGDRFL